MTCLTCGSQDRIVGHEHEVVSGYLWSHSVDAPDRFVV
eukprot:COSAG02_NODE_12850_length_1483_cov_1.048410_1_plen_37_part_10